MLARQVLEQGAVHHDVDELEASADAEHRHVALQRLGEEQAFQRVSPLVRRPAGRQGRLAVDRRVDVVPARQQQAVEPVEDLGDI